MGTRGRIVIARSSFGSIMTGQEVSDPVSGKPGVGFTTTVSPTGLAVDASGGASIIFMTNALGRLGPTNILRA